MIGYYYYLSKIRPYFTQSEKTDYTLILITLLAVLFFGLLGLRPLIASAARAYSQLKGGREYELQLTEKILAINQASTNFFSATGVIGDLGTIMPEGPSQPQVIQELDRDAGTAGVTLRSVAFRPEAGADGGKVGTHTFDFFAAGAENTLVPFLEELEKGQLLELQLLQTNLRLESGGRSLEILGRGSAFFIR